jgi:hypothetical protein
MLYCEIIAVCSKIPTKHINTLCGQNVEFLNVKPGGTYSDPTVYGTQNFIIAFTRARQVHLRGFCDCRGVRDRLTAGKY